MSSVRYLRPLAALLLLGAAAPAFGQSKIFVNEFFRNTTMTATGDEWAEVVLREDLSAAQLETFFVGDSTTSRAAKFSGYRFTNMSTIAATFKAGTIIVVSGGVGPASDISYNPAGGDWNLVLRTNGANLTANANAGDIAATDVVYVDTSIGNATLSTDGFAVTWPTATGGAFGDVASVRIAAPGNTTGAVLTSDFAGATTTGNWTGGVALASMTPGLPNGGANTTYIDSLRAVPVPQLSINDVSISEGNAGPTTYTFTVSLDIAAAGAFTVDFATQDGTAQDDVPNTEDEDYVAQTGTLNFAGTAGETHDVVVTVNGDTELEADETFSVLLSNVSIGTVQLADATGTGTLVNDEAPLPVLSIADVTQNEGTAACAGGITDFAFTVTAIPAPQAGSDIGFTFSIGGGTATVASDYSLPAQLSGTIASPASSTTITVPVSCDADFEGDETFDVTLAAPANATIGDGLATGTISNDDAPAVPQVSIADASVAEGPASGTSQLEFTITTTGVAVGDVSFDVSVNDGTATLANGDYVDNDQLAFTIPAASVPGTVVFSVTVTGDAVPEPGETLSVTLANPVNAQIADGTATGTIQNDDVSIAIADASANEADTTNATATFVVTLSQALGSDLAVTATTADGSATGTTSPADYVALPGTQFTLAAGGTTLNIPVTVLGDLRDDDAETFTVSIVTSDPTVQVADGSATGTIVDNDGATLTIAQIQGDTGTSPVAASTQTSVNNVVTAVLNNGVILQSIAPDADANTSEGLLLFTGGVPALTGGGTIAVGDVLDVRGRIVEFATAGSSNTVTEFANSGPTPIIVRTATGQALPATTAFDPFVSEDLLLAAPCTGPGGFRSNFECVEHMRGAVTSGTITGPNQTFASDPAAEMWFAFGTDRTFREPGIRDDAFADPALTGLGLPRWDGNPEVIEIDMDRLGQANTILAPGTLISAPAGILSSEFGGYEFWPSAPVIVAQPAPAQSNPVIAIPEGELAIGAINVENFFDTVQVSEAPSPAVDDDLTQAEFDAKMTDFVAYVCDTMKAPHVLGLIEIENQAVLDSMAAALNGRVGCLPAGSTYAATFNGSPGTLEGNDPRYIDVGFLARSEVTVTAVTQLGKTQTTNECSGASPCTLHDRPPLLLEGSFPVPNEAAMPFAVMVNHLRSLNGIEGPDSPGVWTDANRIRRKRLDQGIDIARRVQAINVANPGRPLVLMGDYNAFEFTDGYADVINVIRGTANVAGDALPRDSQYEIQDLYPAEPGNIVNPPLSNALDTLPAAEQYSYTFEGNAQTIDHVLLNGPADARRSGFAYARGNADAPEAVDIDPGVPIVRDFRLTDHDGPVLRLKLANLIFSDGFED